jgi:hypothetical protein
VIEWLCDRWGIEKEIDAPDYIVALGSGVLRDEGGKPTRASSNVVDKCFSLYLSGGGARAVVIVGGKPWRLPPFSDAELMQKRLLELSESAVELEPLGEGPIVLDGHDNTYRQILALGRFLSQAPGSRVIIVCPRLQTRRLRALLRKHGLFEAAGIASVDDGCEPFSPVERFRWSKAGYLLKEMLACIHHRLASWL